MDFLERLILRILGPRRYFVLDHLSFAGLTFVFLVASYYILDIEAYAALAVAISFVFMFQLACNSTALEPLQVYFGRFATFKMVRAMAVAIGLAYLLTLTAVVIFLMLSGYDPTVYRVTLAVSALSIVQLIVFACRRLILAMQDVRTSIAMNLIQAAALVLSLGVAKVATDASGSSSAAIWSYLALYLAPCLYAIWMLLRLSRDRGEDREAPAAADTTRHIVATFLHYSRRTIVTIPLVWLFGNFIFVFGGRYLSAEDLATYRMVLNVVNPLLQYFSAVGIQALSHFSTADGSGPGIEREVLRLLRGNLVVAVGYGACAAVAVFAFLRVSGTSSDILRMAAPVFCLQLVYICLESLNYVFGSLLRARRDFRKLLLATSLPTVLLAVLLATLASTRPGEWRIVTLQICVVVALAVSLCVVAWRLFAGAAAARRPA